MTISDYETLFFQMPALVWKFHGGYLVADGIILAIVSSLFKEAPHEYVMSLAYNMVQTILIFMLIIALSDIFLATDASAGFKDSWRLFFNIMAMFIAPIIPLLLKADR